MSQTAILIFLYSCNLFAQDIDKTHNADLVEAYYDTESENPLYIYDGVNGNIVDTLKTIEAGDSWYKIAIINSEYGWFKIKDIQLVQKIWAA